MAEPTAKYLKAAARAFLDGLDFKHPHEAVAAGVRSLEEWTECLAEHRGNRAFLQSRLDQLERARKSRYVVTGAEALEAFEQQKSRGES